MVNDSAAFIHVFKEIFLVINLFIIYHYLKYFVSLFTLYIRNSLKDVYFISL